VVAWCAVPSLQVARRLLLHCDDALGTTLEGFEVMPRASVEAVLNYLPTARAPLAGDHAWHVLVEAVADKAGAAVLRDQVEAAIAGAFEAGLVEDAVFSGNEAQAEAFWTIRDSVAPAERAKGPAMQHDISVPVELMPDFVDHASAKVEAAFPGVEAVAFGHLGDGNVHFHAIAPAGSDYVSWQETTGKEISSLVNDMVTEWGGSISAEHGIGQLKVGELERLGDPVALAMLRQVKQALDPRGLLNPGKLVRPAAQAG